MNGYVGNTDFDWYTFLCQQENLDEVNFWQPSGGRGFRTLLPGEPFFFKLKKPHYAIAGFGFFARHSVLPAWLAWEAFEIANGAPTFDVMRRRIEKYRRTQKPDPAAGYQIGCIMITSPIFFPEDDWIEQPRDWKKNVVQGATYDLAHGEGRRIWEECWTRATRGSVAEPFGEQLPLVAGDAGARYGLETVIRPRLGQGTFRIAVIEAYCRACAISTEHSLPALEAAHVRPYADGGEHAVDNGLLLRSDIHRLFDKGYITVTPDYQVEVSRRLKDDFDNGHSYYGFRGTKIELPGAKHERPSKDLLAWHNENIYLG